jgi:outer membrane lipoprotein-sorting protein
MLKLLLLAVFLRGAPLPAKASKAAEMTALEVYEKVLKAQKDQAALECRIVREDLKAQGEAQKVSGTLKVAAGGKARLDITFPSRQLVVSDGKALYIQMDDVKQVMKYDAQQLKKGGNFFLDLGSSIRFYAKASLKRLIEAGPGFDPAKTAALELMPLDPRAAGFERMRVWVDRGEWLVRRVELKVGGVDTRVSFEKVLAVTRAEAAKGAKVPPDSEFRYAAPKGYEVFDLASMQ